MAYDQRIQDEVRALWRSPALIAHFADVSDLDLRTSFRMRQPTLEEVLGELGSFGEYVLGSHDERGEVTLVRDYACSVRLRGWEGDDGLVIGSGLSPVLAALRCLIDVLRMLELESTSGVDEFESFLRDL